MPLNSGTSAGLQLIIKRMNVRHNGISLILPRLCHLNIFMRFFFKWQRLCRCFVNLAIRQPRFWADRAGAIWESAVFHVIELFNRY